MSNIQITENGPGKYSPEWFYSESQTPEWISFAHKADELRENFINLFGIERLKSLSGKDLLTSLFYNDEGTKTNASQIAWQLDDSENQLLPKMQTDIMLSQGNNILIIDAKYYSHMTQQQYGTNTLHSNNLYQIFTYVKNKEFELRKLEHTVSGMLLYAQTDEYIIPNNTYQMSGNQISVRALNLNQDFSGIAHTLDDIIQNSFNN